MSVVAALPSASRGARIDNFVQFMTMLIEGCICKYRRRGTCFTHTRRARAVCAINGHVCVCVCECVQSLMRVRPSDRCAINILISIHLLYQSRPVELNGHIVLDLCVCDSIIKQEKPFCLWQRDRETVASEICIYGCDVKPRLMAHA